MMFVAEFIGMSAKSVEKIVEAGILPTAVEINAGTVARRPSSRAPAPKRSGRPMRPCSRLPSNLTCISCGRSRCWRKLVSSLNRSQEVPNELLRKAAGRRVRCREDRPGVGEPYAVEGEAGYGRAGCSRLILRADEPLRQLLLEPRGAFWTPRASRHRRNRRKLGGERGDWQQLAGDISTLR